MKPHIRYKEYVGIPEGDDLRGIFRIMTAVFERLHLTPEEYVDRLLRRRLVFTVIAYHNNRPVAFKLGYEKSPSKFVSQLGGVLLRYRGLGIANELMRRQHRWCFIKMKYQVIQTESMNRYRDMMALNLKHRFSIVGTYYDRAYDDIKILFEKHRT